MGCSQEVGVQWGDKGRQWGGRVVRQSSGVHGGLGVAMECPGNVGDSGVWRCSRMWKNSGVPRGRGEQQIACRYPAELCQCRCAEGLGDREVAVLLQLRGTRYSGGLHLVTEAVPELPCTPVPSACGPHTTVP